MQTITLPLWQIATAAGVPTCLLLMLVLRLLRLKRKRQSIQPTITAKPPERFGEFIQQQVMSQQIDAIFNALAAVIEAERIKLKALILHSFPGQSQPPSSTSCMHEKSASFKENEKEPTVGQSIVELADEGIRADEIARKLGISKNEVALAIKMNRGASEPKRARLEAVA
jgi:plasmid maintenance system antidote protein VapI